MQISTRRRLSFNPPAKTYIELVGVDKAIESYNRIITLPESPSVVKQIEGLRKDFIERDIITEDHEGPISIS